MSSGRDPEVDAIIRRGDERDRDAHSLAGALTCSAYAFATLCICAGILALAAALAVGR